MDNDRVRERIRKRLGYHPGFVGGAALIGGETVNQLHPASLISALLAEVTKGGKKIPRSMHNFPVDDPLFGRLAGFSGKDLRSISKFKKSQLGSKAPIIPVLGGSESHAVPLGDPMGGLINFGKRVELDRTSVPVAMHEIGHVTPVLGGGHPNLNVAWHAGTALSKLLKYPLMAQVLTPPDDDSSRLREFAYDHAPELVAAAYMPTILEEMRATGHALKGAHRYGPGALTAAKELVPALGTYVASGLLPSVLATILAKKLVKHLYDTERDDSSTKEASSLGSMARAYMKCAGASMKPSGALRNSMSIAYNNTPPSPQTTPVGGPQKVKADATGVKPRAPSKTRFYNDIAKSNLGYSGSRQGVPG